MLLNRRVNVFKKVLFIMKTVNNTRKVEECYVNSDYDTTSTGSNESEVSVQLSTSKTSDSPSIKATKELKVKRLSKSVRKKFFRHFSNVEEEEEVLNRYSCALIGDMLLQGHLFVTSNYFAFYSNVFGYVTRILIPILSVEKITKEKTAKIIPNAIGIATTESRYVFGSLLSRDSTLEYFKKIWEKVKNEAPNRMLTADLMEEDIDSSEIAENESERDERDEIDEVDEVDQAIQFRDSKKIQPKGSMQNEMQISSRRIKSVSYFKAHIKKISHPRLMLITSILMLILLYLTASILLYRINQMQNKYSRALHDIAYSDSKIVYNDLLQWQAELYTKSEEAVYGLVDSNLDKLAKVRRSLETLSSLLETQTIEETIVNASESAEGFS